MIRDDDDALTAGASAPDGPPAGAGTESSSTGDAFEGLWAIFEDRADASELPTCVGPNPDQTLE